jgi:hypothetical protein
LFIFLVGETPTTGVSEPALEVAVKAARYLNPEAQLTLAGRTYSGSLKALCTNLQRLRKKVFVRLASGTVTQPGAKKMVENDLGPGSYDSLVHNDQRALAFFFQYVDEQWRRPYPNRAPPMGKKLGKKPTIPCLVGKAVVST